MAETARESTQQGKQCHSKPYHHITQLNEKILNSSDTRALCRGRDGHDRQTDRDRDRDRDEQGGRERERYYERERTRDRELDRDRERDIDPERGCERDRQYTLTQRPSKQYSIELNKEMMRISDTRELCDFMSTHSAEFNHVNVSILSQNTSGFTGRRGQIRAARTRHVEEFRPQEISNLLHISFFVKTRYKTCLLPELERRAEEISGEINSQKHAECCQHAVGVCDDGDKAGGSDDGVAGAADRTLWAFATMGTKPGDRMLGHLERQAEAISGEFNSQDIANTLWAICFFRLHFNLSLLFCCSLSLLPSTDFDNQKHLCQFH